MRFLHVLRSSWSSADFCLLCLSRCGIVAQNNNGTSSKVSAITWNNFCFCRTGVCLVCNYYVFFLSSSSVLCWTRIRNGNYINIFVWADRMTSAYCTIARQYSPQWCVRHERVCSTLLPLCAAIISHVQSSVFYISWYIYVLCRTDT